MIFGVDTSPVIPEWVMPIVVVIVTVLGWLYQHVFKANKSKLDGVEKTVGELTADLAIAKIERQTNLGMIEMLKSRIEVAEKQVEEAKASDAECRKRTCVLEQRIGELVQAQEAAGPAG